MNSKKSNWATWLATAVVILLAACKSNDGGPAGVGGNPSGGQTQGGAHGNGGQGGQSSGTGGIAGNADGKGGQSAAAGGKSGDTGGQAGQGGVTQATSSGGSSGGSGGRGGQGGQAGATVLGGNLGGVGGTSGLGGLSTEPRRDAAAGAGGQGGGTSQPQADASDTAVGGTGGNPGTDGGGAGKDGVASDALAGNPRRVLLCDEGNRRVLLIDLQSPSSAIWSTSLSDTNKYGDGMRDIQLVGGDRVAVSVAKGYVEIDIKTGEIKKEVTKLTGVESLRRLPNGNTVLGGNSDGGVTLQELDSQDAAVSGRKVTFTTFSQFRMLRRTPQGTFLIGAANTLAEVNWDKQTVWKMDFAAAAGHDPNYIYQGLRMSDNNIAVTTGYSTSLVIVDPAAKKALTTIGGQGQPNASTISPYFYAGFQILPNGHFVVTNWEGHGAGNGGKGLQLLEYDSAGTLVWSWKQDPKLVSSLHNVIVLDGLDTTKLHDDVNGVLAPVTQ
jgi:hypothetical protein